MQRILLFFFCCTLHTLVFAAPPTEAYAKLPDISQLAISPSGERFAFRTASDHNDLVVVVDQKTQQRVGIVDVSGVKPTHIYFASDTKVILITETYTKILGYRGRHNISTASVYNLENGKIHRLLTPGNGIHDGQTNVGRVVGMSPEGDYAFMPAYFNENEFSLLRANMETDRRPRRHKTGTADTIDFFVNASGEVLARERYSNESNLHRVEAWVDNDWKTIYEHRTDVISMGVEGVTPDNTSLVVKRLNAETERWAYYTMNLATGEISAPIFSHDERDVESLVIDINRTVYGAKYSGFKPHYEFFDKKLNARIAGIAKALPDVSISIVDYTPSWEHIVVLMEGRESAGDYLLYHKGSLSFLASARDAIPPSAVHDVSIYHYRARDGMNIPSLLTLPKDKAAERLPAILHPHGGPESYDRYGFDYMAQFFASKGYAVIQPQFRGSSGFGLSHQHAGRGEWGRKMQDDLTDSVNDLVSKGIIDKHRVCIVGASYGGYAALAGAVFSPELFRCVVAINGVADVAQMVASDRSQYGANHWVVSYWERVIARGEYNKDHLKAISPINHVRRVKAPILLIHGEYDDVVNVKQSKIMAEALSDEGKDVQWLLLEKGDHYLSSPANRLKALQAMDRFLSKHLL